MFIHILDTYQAAERQVEAAENTSNLDSDPEEVGANSRLRNRKKPAFFETPETPKSQRINATPRARANPPPFVESSSQFVTPSGSRNVPLPPSQYFGLAEGSGISQSYRSTVTSPDIGDKESDSDDQQGMVVHL